MVAMSIPVDVRVPELGDAEIARFGPRAFLVTTSAGGPPHVASVLVSLEADNLVMRVGRTTRVNATSHPAVTLLWTDSERRRALPDRRRDRARRGDGRLPGGARRGSAPSTRRRAERERAAVNRTRLSLAVGSVALVRIGAGLALGGAPRSFLRWEGEIPEGSAMTLLMRTVGIRDLALGLGTAFAARSGTTSDLRRWIGAGLLSDALDVAAGLAGARTNGVRGVASALVACAGRRGRSLGIEPALASAGQRLLRCQSSPPSSGRFRFHGCHHLRSPRPRPSSSRSTDGSAFSTIISASSSRSWIASGRLLRFVLHRRAGE